ncbi:hypothetical protein ABPG75_010029 [Micractinium tetrahymenae]
MEPAEALAGWPPVGSSVAVQPYPPATDGAAAPFLASNSLHSDQTAEGATRAGQGPAAEPGRRRKPGRPAREKACMVCGVLLPKGEVPSYFRRYRICAAHRDALSVHLRGHDQRFCQQCGTFHPLAKFSGNRRSCRERLHKHAIRRRKGSDGGRPGSHDLGEEAAEQEEVEEAGAVDTGSEGSESLGDEGRATASPPRKRRRSTGDAEASTGSEGPSQYALQQRPEPTVVIVAAAPAPASPGPQQGAGQAAALPAPPPPPALQQPQQPGQQAAPASNGWQWMAAWNDPGWSTTGAALPEGQQAQQAQQAVRPGNSCPPTAEAAAPAAAGADNPLSALAAAAAEEAEHEKEERWRHAQQQAQTRAAAGPGPPMLPSAGAAAAAALLLQHAEAQQRAQQEQLAAALAALPTAPAGMQQQQRLTPSPVAQLLACAEAGSGGLLAAAAAAIASAAAMAVPGAPADMLQVLLASSTLGRDPHPTAVAAAMLAVQQEQQRRRQAAQQQALLSALAVVPGQASPLAALGGLLQRAQQAQQSLHLLLPPPLLRLSQPLQAQLPLRERQPTPAAGAASMERQQEQHVALLRAAPLPTAAPRPRQAPPTLGPLVSTLPAAATAAVAGRPAAGMVWGGFPVTTGMAASAAAMHKGPGL